MNAILTITGSDNSGATGIQADIKTISAMQCDALTAVTAVTVQDHNRIHHIMDLPEEMVVGQVRAIVETRHPAGIKIGLLRQADTIRAIRSEVVGARHLLLIPGILSSRGEQLMDHAALEAWKLHLIPMATLLMVRCDEAELLLGCTICSDDDMLLAAQRLCAMGAEAVFLRGGHQTHDRLTALLYTPTDHHFYSSHNTQGWKRHGVGAALSSAVLARLVLGDSLTEAMTHAHAYMHSQVLYAVNTRTNTSRPADIYNQLMQLLATHYREQHGVVFYADRLSISTRYLSDVTQAVAAKSPKAVINDYLLQEAIGLLQTTRMTVGEIAFHLGFTSPAAFTTWFSAQKGASPTSVRG